MTNDQDNEVSDLRQAVRKLARDRIAPRLDQIESSLQFPHDIVEMLGQIGLLSLCVPEECGGLGKDLRYVAALAEELAEVDVSTAVTFNAHSSCVRLVDMLGSDDQRRRYFAPVVSEGSLFALALSEPDAGSDAAAIATRATREGNAYVLNGTKHFCTNADVAGMILVFAVTKPGAGSHGISIFAVARDNPGLIIGRSEQKMGLHGTTTIEFTLSDARVDARDLLGPENEGFGAAMELLQHGRVGVGAIAVGAAQGAIDYACTFARERRQFGRPIAAFQAVQFMLADMAMATDSARQMVRHAVELGISGDAGFARASASAKCLATDSAMRVAVDAVQVLGGSGYLLGCPVERVMRDVKVLQIFEGTNQLMRMLVARDLVGRFPE
jgi:alkylation response protein AidB-like acyl-CoA dehydrogenase